MKRKAEMMKRFFLMGLILFAFIACDDDDRDDDMDDPVQEFSYDFSQGANGWIGDFADYPQGQDDRFELTFGETTLPAPLNENEGALVLSGTNLSDDLFMYLKKQISGLEPNTEYEAVFTVQFASNVPDGMIGIGGSPGESVWIKAGATGIEPEPESDDMGYLRMNIDKGGQSQGGDDMVVLGDFSNDTDQELYNLKIVTNEAPLEVTTDGNGNLWLIVGTDSGFEGTTMIFYNRIHVTLEEDD